MSYDIFFILFDKPELLILFSSKIPPFIYLVFIKQYDNIFVFNNFTKLLHFYKFK